MRILLISDTHGKIPFDLESLHCDILLHAGDIGPSTLMNSFYTFTKWHAVAGNTDFDLIDTIPQTFFTHDYGPSIFMVHNLAAPHRMLIENRETIKSLNPSLVVYGHTHMPDITERDNRIFVNPGSLGKLGLTNIASYAIVTTEKSEVKKIEIFNVEDNTIIQSWNKTHENITKQ